MALDTSTSNASIRQSVEFPDFFTCQNCRGWKSQGICEALRSEGICAKQLLAGALASGAVRVVLHVPAARLPGGER